MSKTSVVSVVLVLATLGAIICLIGWPRETDSPTTSTPTDPPPANATLKPLAAPSPSPAMTAMPPDPPVIRVHDIRDLLVHPVFGISPPFQLSDSGERRATAAPPRTPRENASFDRDQLVDALIKMLTSTVAADSWRENGGTVGTIRELNGQFVILQSLENQRAIQSLLNQLRQGRSIQVALEGRMFLVDEATFQAVYPKATAASPSPGGRPAAAGAAGELAQAPEMPASLGYFPENQLEGMLKKIQASPNTSSLTMPRVTLFNGQPGFVTSTNHQNYIASVTTRKDDNGKDATELNVRTFISGILLNVTATVSADRKSVILAVNPVLRKLDGVDTITLGDGAKTSPLGGPFVQLPRWHGAEISSTVNVPDGNVLFIGGMKYAGEFPIERSSQGFEVSPPVADPPLRHLLLLLRPTIIIHKEIETGLMK